MILSYGDGQRAVFHDRQISVALSSRMSYSLSYGPNNNGCPGVQIANVNDLINPPDPAHMAGR